MWTHRLESCKSRKKNDTVSQKKLDLLLEQNIDFLSKNPEEKVEDDEDIFGKMVAATLLRECTHTQKMFARKKMNDVLFDIELDNFKSQPFPVNSTNSPNVNKMTPNYEQNFYNK